jgi:hypothetical protein
MRVVAFKGDAGFSGETGRAMRDLVGELRDGEYWSVRELGDLGERILDAVGWRALLTAGAALVVRDAARDLGRSAVVAVGGLGLERFLGFERGTWF